MSDELERAWNNASSFGDKNRPRDLKYIGKIIRKFKGGDKEFLFYKDTDNQFWYESRSIKK
jgi:hypothetical protein